MPTEPQQKDLVVEARGLLAKMSNGTRIKEAQLAPLLSESRSLLRQLCDEVERLRKSNKSMADELGHQDSYWDDPLRGNFKC